jgi:signal transduction histidine kinase
MHVAEQRKDEFIGIASHELKTPITTVKVYLQLLQKMVESGKSNKIGVHLEKMDSQVDKLTKLVSDLLDISKIQAEKLEFNKTNFKIDDLVREIVEMLKGTIPTHSIIKKLEAKRSAYGDRDRIGQVLINLITNAAKYSPKADRIVISTNVKNGFAIVSVQDFGIGISAEHQDKVFNRFFRVEGIHEKTYPGFGMGLFISAEIIHRHGGTISVASKPGKGSTFSFTVPLEKKSFKKK